MPFGWIDDHWWRHRKTMALAPSLRGDAAFLFWAAISWSNDQLADGLISVATVRILGFDVIVAEELARVGFWDPAGEGVWQVHDYGHFNKLRAQVLADKAAAALRQAEWRKKNPGRRQGSRSQRDQPRDQGRDTDPAEQSTDVDNQVSQRDQRSDQQRDPGRSSQVGSRRTRPVSRSPFSESPDSVASPPPPASQGHRSNGTNPRAARTNPRATGDAPRQNGDSPRQEREALKRGPTALGDIMAETLRRQTAGKAQPNGHASTGQGSLFDEPAG